MARRSRQTVISKRSTVGYHVRSVSMFPDKSRGITRASRCALFPVPETLKA